jgi:UDP-N-acetylmuramoylalanine--D-glutamate ligase
MTTPLQHQHVAVLGAGRSGLAAALLARAKGGRATVFDSAGDSALGARLQALAAAGIPAVTGAAARELEVRPGEFDLAVLSPGIDASWELAQAFARAGVPLTGETEFAWRWIEKPVLAITGTNGKTTCTELAAAMLNHGGLRSIPCGNHGVPLSEVVTSGVVFDVLAAEVSSFQLETIETFHPTVAVWLNFADDHLDRYPSREAYFAAKSRIFMNSTANDVAVVRAGETVDSGAARRVTFSAGGAEADWQWNGGVITRRGEVVGRTDRVRLLGRHNMENILAAMIACEALGVAPERSLEAAAAFQPAPHRCEWVRDLDGRRYVNDSKATNAHAAIACVTSLDQPVVLIAGGVDKHLDYSALPALAPHPVKAVVAIGAIAGQLAELFADRVPAETAPDLPSAVRRARELSAPGDAIVLSPTTSSFDMFTGYPQRGEVFRQAVLALE